MKITAPPQMNSHKTTVYRNDFMIFMNRVSLPLSCWSDFLGIIPERRFLFITYIEELEHIFANSFHDPSIEQLTPNHDNAEPVGFGNFACILYLNEFQIQNVFDSNTNVQFRLTKSGPLRHGL